jgi:hypothetical protein
VQYAHRLHHSSLSYFHGPFLRLPYTNIYLLQVSFQNQYGAQCLRCVLYHSKWFLMIWPPEDPLCFFDLCSCPHCFRALPSDILTHKLTFWISNETSDEMSTRKLDHFGSTSTRSIPQPNFKLTALRMTLLAVERPSVTLIPVPRSMACSLVLREQWKAQNRGAMACSNPFSAFALLTSRGRCLDRN